MKNGAIRLLHGDLHRDLRLGAKSAMGQGGRAEAGVERGNDFWGDEEFFHGQFIKLIIDHGGIEHECRRLHKRV